MWVNAWDVLFRESSRGGRGRWAAVELMVCFRWGGFVRFYFFSDFFFSSNSHDLLQVWGRLA